MPTVPRTNNFGPVLLGTAPRGSPRSETAGAGEIAAGVMRLGEALTQQGAEMRARELDMRRRSRTVLVSTEIARRANERRVELMQNPGEPATMLDRFRVGTQSDFDELTSEIDDPETQLRIQERALPLLESEAQRVVSHRVALETNLSKEADAQAREAAVRGAIASGTLEEREAHIGAYLEEPKPFFSEADRLAAENDVRTRVAELGTRRDVDQLVREGRFIDAWELLDDAEDRPFMRAGTVVRMQEYVATQARIAREQAEADRERLAKRDGDRLANSIVSGLAQLDIQIEQSRGEASTFPDRPNDLIERRQLLVERLMEGLDRMAVDLSPSQFGAVVTAIEGSAAVEDSPEAIPIIEQALRDRTQTPGERADTIDSLYANGRLSTQSYRAYSTQIRSDLDDYQPPDFTREMMDEIDGAFRAGFLEDPSVKNRLRARAKQELNEFVRSNPAATPRELRAETDRVLQRYEAPTTVETLAIPEVLRDEWAQQESRGFTRRSVTLPMVDAARARVVHDRRLTEDERKREMMILDAWRAEIETLAERQSRRREVPE